MRLLNGLKPLGGPAYGHIPHLPGSRLGPGDHHCAPGQARIATVKTRDRHDRVIVQEKLDGSNCAVYRDGDIIIPLTRAGYRAHSSPYDQHHWFARWVAAHQDRFLAVIRPGEWLVGEWLAQAHGTRYLLPHEPFVVFDLILGRDPRRGFRRLSVAALQDRLAAGAFIMPHLLHEGGAFGIDDVQHYFARYGSAHGALDPPEGAVWRVERDGHVDFLVKWVRPDKIDGQYLPEVSGQAAVWQWHPSSLSVAVIPPSEGGFSGDL